MRFFKWLLGLLPALWHTVFGPEYADDGLCNSSDSGHAPGTELENHYKQALVVACRLLKLDYCARRNELSQIKRDNDAFYALVKHHIQGIRSRYGDEDWDAKQEQERVDALRSQNLQRVMREALEGDLRDPGMVVEGNEGLEIVATPADVLSPAANALTIPLSTLPSSHVVGGGARYKNADGTPRDFREGEHTDLGEAVPASGARQVTQAMMITSAVSGARVPDNSKFPAFLRKVHAEVMDTPEGRRVKAREQAELAYAAEKAEQGEPHLGIPDAHSRAIPVDSFPATLDHNKPENP